jgi:alpha-L-arabinofuranosidase
MKTMLKWAILAAAISCSNAVLAEEVRISVAADQVAGQVTRHLTGACIEDVNHEIYGGIYSQMIFGESFQEPPVSAPVKDFKAFGGQWTVRDGSVESAAAEGSKLMSDHRSMADGSISVEMKFANRKEGNAGLIARVNRPGVGADRFIGYEISLDPSRQIVRLGKHRFNFELIEDAPCEIPVDKWNPVEVKFNGSKIEILVSGKSAIQRDLGDDSLPAGAVGLRNWNLDSAYRNLSVKTGEKSESLAFAQGDESQQISGMWRAVCTGTAKGKFSIVAEKPFIGKQSQQIAFASGEGTFGIENQGLNRWGMGYVADKPYEGYVWVRTEKPVKVIAALESRDGAKRYAETTIDIAAGDWKRIDFKLTPSVTDKAGRFSLLLNQPGTVEIGHAFLQPGDWGRFKGLPVRRDVAEALIDQGITVLRYGGSMINHPEYRWKKMYGPRDRRPPSPGTWYPYSTNGWAIPDFMDFCEAAGFEYIPDLNVNEKPEDIADFMDYAKGSAETEGGRRRIADGRKEPYKLHYLELGNEEAVNEEYAAKFEKLAKVIWTKDPNAIVVVGDFGYSDKITDPAHITGNWAGITNLAGQQRILKFAKENNREVWFDLHVNTEFPEKQNASLIGMLSFIDALTKMADGAKFKVVIFEYNAGNHAQKRALSNALTTNHLERDGRLPIITSANCLQPDGQNDNDWDQGLLFLDPSQVWLQPPGYVTQMFSRNYQPKVVKCEVAGGSGDLDVTVKRSEDGKTLVLQAVNIGDKPIEAKLQIAGFSPGKETAQVTELSGPMEAVNTAENPKTITPKQIEWKHKFKDGATSYSFPPRSFSVMRFE